MGKRKIKTKRGVTTITNKLGKFERLNMEELRLLINHVVEGLAPVSVTEKWGRTILQVEQPGLVSLSAYMQAGIDSETALVCIWNTLRISYDCERYGLRMDNLCWDPEQVFVDSGGNLMMIYWPMTTLEQATLTPMTFYGGFCEWMKGGYVTPDMTRQYMDYFYQRSYFDFQEFYGLAQDIITRCQEEKRRRKEKAVHNVPDRTYHAVNSGWLERSDGSRIPLNLSRTVFGRAGGKCHVELNGHASVSRTHAKISNKEGQYYLTDLESRNGTFVCGLRQKPGVRVLLKEGDKIRFGNAEFVFHQTDPSATISIHQMNRR